MPGTLTPLGQALALDFLFDATAVTRPTAWYLALHTGANGGAGINNELSGNGYARQPVTYSRSSNVLSNTALVAFGPDVTVNWGLVTDLTVWDSVVAGRCLAQGPATASVSYVIGETATVAIGAHTITLT